MRTKTVKRTGAVIALLGMLLLITMVMVEGEPGALPLGLVAFGGAVYAFAVYRAKRLAAK